MYTFLSFFYLYFSFNIEGRVPEISTLQSIGNALQIAKQKNQILFSIINQFHFLIVRFSKKHEKT